MASLNEAQEDIEVTPSYSDNGEQNLDAVHDGSLEIDESTFAVEEEKHETTSQENVNKTETENENASSEAPNNSEEGKLFLGGLSWDTTEEKLKEHFSKYGEIQDVVVMREPVEGRSRGFGFVHFTSAEMADSALEDSHTIDNKTIDAKKAVPKGSSSKGSVKVTKIFVGGVAPGVSESDITLCFSKFGAVSSVNIMLDKETSRPRGFAFVEFEDPSSVKAAMAESEVKIGDKAVDIKPAMPRVRYQAPMGRPGFQQHYPRQGPAFRGRPYYNRHQGPPAYGGYPKQQYAGSKYGMATGPRPYVQNGYGYGGGYQYAQPNMQSRYQQPRPATGYGASASGAQGYGQYNRYYPQNGDQDQGPSGYGARPRYPSRPPQSRPAYGFHPYQR